VHFVKITMDDVVAPTQGKYPLQARIGRFIAQCFFVALLHPGRKHRAPPAVAVVARDFEKIGPLIRIGQIIPIAAAG
jgi:hypothetical protein